MKRIIKISTFLLLALIIIFGITFFVLYSGFFPILTGFNINNVLNKDTNDAENNLF